ncbi:3-deoxy-D-manno-octulosonic acid transferase [Candidatus Palauibacter sp.]|uniref:3-deoxy-D-manno-octulosonic acid transferase n=1 Tax=Candidatus Palauibacter sp. TaxID=3101350 RepID=UPI003B5C3E04
MNAGARLSGAGARAVLALEPLIRRAWPELGRALSARRAAAAELAAWGRRREPGPLVWLHGASAGELLGAAPAVRILRAREVGRPGRRATLLVTHSSPSGRPALEWLDPDRAGYPPLDHRRDCDSVLAAVRPGLLVFAKLDVWPGLAAAAARAGTPTALINGTVRPGSRRSGAVALRLFRESYVRLATVGAASPEDARRLAALGVRSDRIEVTGDAAFDLALERADRARADGSAAAYRSALGAPGARTPRLVAGSTWAADEAALLDAVATVRREGGPGWQLVIAPHEPTAARVRELLASCAARGVPAIRWSRLGESATAPAGAVIAFDEVGRLAELYAAGDAAYVGGGLGGTGLHNVLEPAAAGLPVLFGPHHDRTDALALVRAGGGLSCSAGALAATLAGLADPAARARHGRAARAFVEADTGAATRTADLLSPLWPAG